MKTRQRWKKNAIKKINPSEYPSSSNPSISQNDDRQSSDDFHQVEPPSSIPSDNSDSDAVYSDYGSDHAIDVHQDDNTDGSDGTSNHNDSESDDGAGNRDSDGQSVDTMEPLHRYCSISTDEAVADIIELYVQHKWTKSSLIDLLKRQQKILPRNNNMPKTLFKLFKYVEDIAPRNEVIKHMYCKKCLAYNSIGPTIKECLL